MLILKNYQNILLENLIQQKYSSKKSNHKDCFVKSLKISNTYIIDD